MDAPAPLASPLAARGLGWAVGAARIIAPFAAALLVGAIILWATGRNAIETYRLLAHYSLGDWSAITNTLAAAWVGVSFVHVASIPLIAAALALAAVAGALVGLVPALLKVLRSVDEVV